MQQTLSGPVCAKGITLHGGESSEVWLKPAEPDTGIRFVHASRADLDPIPARLDRVLDTQLATTLGNAEWSVRTTEHLLAAAYGLGIDNMIVTIAGDELPALDGSAADWVEYIRTAGIAVQDKARVALTVTEVVEVRDGDRWARLEPADGLAIDITIDFDAPVGRQHLEMVVDPDGFAEELAWARTFGFEKHVAAMHRMGLVRGGSLDNAVVFGDTAVLNPGGLRSPDEPVRHKALDVLGDLALLGCPLNARVVVERPGHGLTVALLHALDRGLAEGQAINHPTGV